MSAHTFALPRTKTPEEKLAEVRDENVRAYRIIAELLTQIGGTAMINPEAFLGLSDHRTIETKWLQDGRFQIRVIDRPPSAT